MHALIRLTVILLIAATGVAANASTERDVFLKFARKGWVYELRTAMWRHDPLVPEIRINGQTLAGTALCVVGERPHPRTQAVLDSFRALMAETFAKPMPLRYAGADLQGCGTGRSVYIRLYSARNPQTAFNADLRWMDTVYGIGLPKGRMQYVLSPAQAQTWFGRRGHATHIMVKQPAPGQIGTLTDLQRTFYTSILIEELYQTFTFGMDILHFDPEEAFVSKLEEYPVDLRNVPWDSPRYMTGLLRSNPRGLCRFDVFMLHAVAGAQVERTNSDAFLDYIAADFDALTLRTDATLTNPAYAGIVDTLCQRLGD